MKCPVGDGSLADPACISRVAEEIAIVQPRIVVVMGEDALGALNDLELPLASRGVAARRDPAADAVDRGARRRRTSTSRSTRTAPSARSGRPSARSARGGRTCRPTRSSARSAARAQISAAPRPPRAARPRARRGGAGSPPPARRAQHLLEFLVFELELLERELLRISLRDARTCGRLYAARRALSSPARRSRHAACARADRGSGLRREATQVSSMHLDQALAQLVEAAQSSTPSAGCDASPTIGYARGPGRAPSVRPACVAS